ncbi:hypothetical protein [Sulfitobacter geojensis]|uniref:hypothetical protein n=1 Tax=Sulfitobacter geojensis TaxID=1342299 RepID=UPI003B8EA4E2
MTSPPNEKGDTLAGLAGSLAFLWIIITVLLQGKELSLQRDEIEKMRITQEKQTGLLVKQAAKLDQTGVDEQIEALVSHLKDQLPKLGFASWSIGKDNSNATKVVFIGQNWEIPDDHKAFAWWIGTISSVTGTVLARCDKETGVFSPRVPDAWRAVESTAREILKISGSASEKQKTWLEKTIRVRDLQKVLADSIDNEELWKN